MLLVLPLYVLDFSIAHRDYSISPFCPFFANHHQSYHCIVARFCTSKRFCTFKAEALKVLLVLPLYVSDFSKAHLRPDYSISPFCPFFCHHHQSSPNHPSLTLSPLGLVNWPKTGLLKTHQTLWSESWMIRMSNINIGPIHNTHVYGQIWLVLFLSAPSDIWMIMKEEFLTFLWMKGEFLPPFPKSLLVDDCEAVRRQREKEEHGLDEKKYSFLKKKFI